MVSGKLFRDYSLRSDAGASRMNSNAGALEPEKTVEPILPGFKNLAGLISGFI